MSMKTVTLTELFIVHEYQCLQELQKKKKKKERKGEHPGEEILK